MEILLFILFFIMLAAFNRGFMKKCYHNECDNGTHVDNQDWNFLHRTVQSLIYAVVDMTVEDSETNACDLKPMYDPAVNGNYYKEEIEADFQDENTLDRLDLGSVVEDIAETAGNHAESVSDTIDSILSQEVGLNSSDIANAVEILMEHLNNQFSKLPSVTSGVFDNLLPSTSTPSNTWFQTSGGNNEFRIGTQINIGSVHIGMPAPSAAEETNGEVKQPNVVLGSDSVLNTDVLAKIVKMYYDSMHYDEVLKNNEKEEGEDTKDRRTYSGKHKNSPMIIKLSPPRIRHEET